MAVLVEHRHRHAEARGLDLASPHRLRRHSQHETGDEIGAAGNGGEVKVGLDRAIYEVEARGRQRRAGGGEGAQRGEPMTMAGVIALLVEGIQVLGRGTEMGHALGVGEFEQHAARGMEGRAVVEQQRRLRGQRAHQPVPHHPSEGGEMEDAVTRLDVAMKPVFLDVLQQRAARAMDDAFGGAGGAAGIKDGDRMVEGQALEGDGLRLEGRQRLVPAHGPGEACEIGMLGGIGHDQGVRHRGQTGKNAAQLLQPVEGPTAVVMAIGGDQHLGGDLAETVQHARNAEIRAGRTPHRADRGGGQHGDDRLRQVGQVADDTVAHPHPPAAQQPHQPADVLVKLGVGERALHQVLAAETDGEAAVAPPQQVLGEIEPGVGKEAGAGHAVAIDQYTIPTGLGDDPALVPDLRPEGRRVGDRPSVEGPIVGEHLTPALRHPRGKGGEVGTSDTLGRRGPQRRRHGMGLVHRYLPCSPGFPAGLSGHLDTPPPLAQTRSSRLASLSPSCPRAAAIV